MNCIKCGAGNATEGEMKHPFCKECFATTFAKSDEKYQVYIKQAHTPCSSVWGVVAAIIGAVLLVVDKLERMVHT